MARHSRRRFLRAGLGLGGLGLLVGCGVTPPRAQPAAVRRIGFLLATSPAAEQPRIEAFRQGLRDLGYAEGDNLIIEWRWSDGQYDRLPALAAELVAVPVEVIVVHGSPAIVAASRATSIIPIVTAGSNVVGTGLVANIARPEGNITGVATNARETLGKWVELLKETAPAISRLAAVQDRASSPNAEALFQAVERAAQPLGLRLAPYDVPQLDQLPAVLAAAGAEGADGLVVLPGGVLGGGADPRIGGEVLRSGLPAVGESRLFAVNGGLLAHGASTGALARRAAGYVDRILKGARPGDLPIELPTTFEIVVNLGTAEALGITIPQSVLLRATELIR